MPVSRNYKDYSKEELLKELHELHFEHELLKTSFAEDISERKLAENKLSASEEKFKKAFNTNPDALCINRMSDGLFIQINEGFSLTTGYSESETRGKTSSELKIWIDPSDRDMIVREISKNGKIRDLIGKFRKKDGSIRDGMMSAAIIELEGVPHILSITRDISDRIRIENALIESERLLRESQDVARLGSFVWDITTGLWNGSIILDEIFGIDEKYYRSFKGWLKIVHPEWRKIMQDYVNIEVLGKHQKFDKEYQIIRQNDSQVRWVHGLSKLDLDNNDQPVKLIGTISDITDRKQAEMDLRKSEEKLQSIFRVAPVGIGLVIDRIIFEVNDTLCNLVGYPRSELIGKSSEFLYPTREEFERVGKEKYAQIAEKGTGSIETLFKCKDGEVLNVILSSTPLDRDDYSRGVTFTVLDITAGKTAEIKVRESEKRYRELFINNPVPTYIFDTDTLEFIEVNDAVIKNYGYSREEFASMTLKDIRLPEEVPDLLNSIRMLGEVPFHSTSMRHVKKDGTVFPVDITSHPLPEKNGRKTRLVLVLDITERIKAAEQMKLAKERAEASDKLKTTFLNNISHEVRTPLNGILGFAEIISQQGLSEEEKRDSLSMLHDSSNRLLTTITNYMDISLLTSGNMSVYKKEFSLAIALKNIFDNYKSVCSGKNLELLLNIPENSDKIILNSDPEILRKIISHLMNNAIKFTARGVIELGFKEYETEIEIFVKDTGTGIHKESVDSIFDHFVKADQGSSSPSEGSGLGLSIARGMVGLIDGNIQVETEVGVGSCFSFTVPILKDSVSVSSGVKYVEPKRYPDFNSILVAEDDETNFYYLKTLLSRETGARVHHASTGREAIELFKTNQDIQLILMDIKMPDLDGFEATKQIKSLNKDIPIIAITAYAMIGDEERVLAAGCDGYLSKPITKKILLDKIAEFIKS